MCQASSLCGPSAAIQIDSSQPACFGELDLHGCLMLHQRLQERIQEQIDCVGSHVQQEQSYLGKSRRHYSLVAAQGCWQ